MANENLKAIGLVKSAIANDATIQINAGKNAMLRMRPYVEAFAKAKETERAALLSSAEEILNASRDRVVAHRKGMHDPNFNSVAKVSAVRASEFRNIMRFGEFKCHREVLNYFSDAVMDLDDVLRVARFCMFKPRPKGEVGPATLLPFDRAAPSKTQCLNALRSRKAERRGNGAGTPRPKDATKAVDVVMPMTKAFMLWFNGDHKAFKEKASKQIEIIVRATAELQSIAKQAKAA